jgi:hypothetical protein
MMPLVDSRTDGTHERTATYNAFDANDSRRRMATADGFQPDGEHHRTATYLVFRARGARRRMTIAGGSRTDGIPRRTVHGVRSAMDIVFLMTVATGDGAHATVRR